MLFKSSSHLQACWRACHEGDAPWQVSKRLANLLPLRLLGGLASPLASRGGSGSPLASGSAVPLTSGSSSASETRSGLPVGGTSLEASLDGGSLLLGGLLLLDLLLGLGLGVAVEVKIGHDVPGGLAVSDGAAEAEDLAGKLPPNGTDGVATLVVGGDGNVDVLGGGVGVAEGNDGDVDVAGLLDGLGVGARVGDDNQAGLLERAGDVVGERTGGEAAGNGGGTSVSGELEDGTLTVGTGRDDANVGRVLDGGDDAGGEDNLLPV